MPPALHGNLPLTAASATIKFDSQTIGYLQKLTITENFNVRQVNGLGSNQGFGYIMGSYDGTANAQKAFIDIDILFDILKPGLTTDEALLYGLDYSYPKGPDREATTNKIKDVNDTFKAVGILMDTLRGKRVSRLNSFASTFEIQIDSYNLNADGTPLSDFEQKPIILLQDCIITSRAFAIDINALVLMQDISIKFLRREI